MCGLTAFVSRGDIKDEHVEAVRLGLSCQRHRGPDATGLWHDDRACFGFNRLSIIDIEGSTQPMRWGPAEDPQRYSMVFNGEIYNYRELRARLIEQFDATFNTEGDGEVIVAGYHYHGAEWVKQLRGMFAFVIWDSVEKVAFGARDWFGIKPMYYADTDAGFVFSSEAKSIREFTGAAVVDAQGLQHYMVLQYVPEPESADANIRRIESGTWFTVRAGEMTQERYFFPEFAPTPISSPAEADALDDSIISALRDSVAKHMRADVTVGSFLSGGVDSTAIAALAKEFNPNLKTFTAGFEREGYSEVDVAAESAEALGVEHHVRIVSEQELFETLPLIVWYLDDPVADPALVPLYFVAHEASKHVKVVLSGEGADELFGGYNIYREPLSLKPLTSLPGGVRKGLAAVSRALPDGIRGKDMLRRGSLNLEERYYGNARIFREDQLEDILRTYSSDVSFRDVTDPVYQMSDGWDPISRMQHIDLFTWQRGDILVKADRVTMANSLELRVPFLDPQVFEIARHIPSDHKITANQSKVALRRAVKKIVPAHVIDRRKLGFPVPTRVYLADDYGYSWARDLILSAGTDRFIDPQAALKLLDAHRAGEADHSRRVWTIIVYMLWYDIFVTGRITPDVPEPRSLQG